MVNNPKLRTRIWNSIRNSWTRFRNFRTLNFKPYPEPVSKGAETLKALAQMFIGMLIFIALVLHLTFKTSCIDLAAFTTLHDKLYNLRIASILYNELNNPFFIQQFTIKYLCIEPLEIVASGLALTAGIELAYMLFTPGPDEAVDPLILGFASTVLLIISKTDPNNPNWENALIVLVFSGALGFLFYIRLKFLPPNKNNKSKEINLARSDLSHKNLININLSEANLIEVNLSHSNLSQSDLTLTKLILANLSDGILINANLTGANLTGANLTGANLTGANLTGANLTTADLSYCDLTGVDLTVIGGIDRAIFDNVLGLDQQQKEYLRNRNARV